MKLLDYGEFLYVGFLYLITLLLPGAIDSISKALFLPHAYPTLMALCIFLYLAGLVFRILADLRIKKLAKEAELDPLDE